MRDEKGSHLFDWEKEYVLYTFSIPPSIKMIKKEGKLASYSRLRSLPSLTRSLSAMLKKGVWNQDPVENEDWPRIFLSRVLLEALPNQK